MKSKKHTVKIFISESTQCSQDLISPINEVVRIHEKGAEQRIRIQGELTRIEAELKQALLEASKRM